jgi:hypothetical protein
LYESIVNIINQPVIPMRKVCIYSAFLFISLFLWSCSTQDHVLPNPDVYVSGFEESEGIFTAKYWKNGVAVNLLSSPRAVLATAVTASNGDVYAVGYEIDIDASSTGKFWKNGVLVNFSKDVYVAQLSDVEVFNGDVYVAGIGYSGADRFAAYWKNGVSVKLPGFGGWARSITVSGNDVYVAGFFFHNSHQVPVYWKNGVPTIVGEGTVDGVADGIAVSGNDVYVVGSEVLNNLNVSRYWKNGVELGITSNKVFSMLSGVAVSNNNVYLVGREIDGSSQLLYWNNFQRLVNGPASYGSAVRVLNNDVYLSGGFHNGSKDVASYWKNGNQVVLSDGTGNATTTSIFVSNP